MSLARELKLRKKWSFTAKAQAAFEAHDFGGSIVFAERALYFDSQEAGLYKLKAAAFFELADLKSAIINLRKALSLRPDDTSIHLSLASLYYTLGCLQLTQGEAKAGDTSLLEAIRLAPLRVEYWIKRADHLCQNGHSGTAIDCLSDCLQCVYENKLEASIAVVAKRAQVLMSLEQFEQAFQDFQWAKQLNPNDERVQQLTAAFHTMAQNLSVSASAHLLSGELDISLRDASLAVKIEPNANTRHLLLRACIYRKQRRFQEALSDLEKVSSSATTKRSSQECERDLANLFNDMAIQEFEEGGFQAAVSKLNRAISLRPNQCSFHINRGDCYRSLNKPQHALADYNAASRLCKDPHSLSNVHTRLSLVHNMFGTELFNAGRFVECEQEFSRAISLNTNVPQYLVNRANAYFHQGRQREAREDYRKALRLDPSDVLVRNRLLELERGAVGSSYCLVERPVSTSRRQATSPREPAPGAGQPRASVLAQRVRRRHTTHRPDGASCRRRQLALQESS